METLVSKPLEDPMEGSELHKLLYRKAQNEGGLAKPLRVWQEPAYLQQLQYCEDKHKVIALQDAPGLEGGWAPHQSAGGYLAGFMMHLWAHYWG